EFIGWCYLLLKYLSGYLIKSNTRQIPPAKRTPSVVLHRIRKISIFFPCPFRYNNPHYNSSNTDYGKDDRCSYKRIVPCVSYVHYIIGSLLKCPADEFCDTQIQIIVIHIKVTPEDRLSLIVHDGICSGAIIEIKHSIHIFGIILACKISKDQMPVIRE